MLPKPSKAVPVSELAQGESRKNELLFKGYPHHSYVQDPYTGDTGVVYPGDSTIYAPKVRGELHEEPEVLNPPVRRDACAGRGVLLRRDVRLGCEPGQPDGVQRCGGVHGGLIYGQTPCSGAALYKLGRRRSGSRRHIRKVAGHTRVTGFSGVLRHLPTRRRQHRLLLQVGRIFTCNFGAKAGLWGDYGLRTADRDDLLPNRAV